MSRHFYLFILLYNTRKHEKIIIKVNKVTATTREPNSEADHQYIKLTLLVLVG